MDYKEKYNAALERARYYHSKDYMLINNAIENIFPELVGSEDEKMRKAIISILKAETRYVSKEDTDKYVAWLEQQGESDETKAKMFLMNKGYPIDANGTFPTYEEMYNIIRDGLEKQGKQTHAELGQSEVTKTSDQELEPRFKVGDWVIANDGTHTYLVKERKRGIYVILDIGEDKEFCIDIETADRTGRLWTIQDAKDGDVLVDSYSEDSIIILYKGIYKERTIMAHCGWNGYNLTVTTNGFGYGGLVNTNYLPATKEQRDLLFQKMADAGYQWDTEKKELKKMKVARKEIDDAYLQGICDAKHELEKQGEKLDADKVVEWLNNQACQGWIIDFEVDKFVEKFKKDFGL